MIDVRTKPAPIETVSPIKPSEAIRLGCLIAPVQGFDRYFGNDDDSACAIGAAALGWSNGEWADAVEADRDIADRIINLRCPHPGCLIHLASVPILNDNHRWSRERIADWLAEQGL